MAGKVLGRDFFERPPDIVAQELIGSIMVVRNETQKVRVRIDETEAYGGLDDPASHSFRGPTKRSAIMFEEAGFLYVYLIYGVHWCMNVVTEREGTASAVLLRAGEVIAGSKTRVSTGNRSVLLRGPGVLTRELGITGADNGVDCCKGTPARIRFERRDESTQFEIGVSQRVGISRGQDRLSRYFFVGSPALSKKAPGI
jgi:DNA-3-methyladenine glycosylase